MCSHKKPKLSPLHLAMLAAFPLLAHAANDTCLPEDCTGMQAEGISFEVPSAAKATGRLNVFGLSAPIAPLARRPGIRLGTTAGFDLTLGTGTTTSLIGITTVDAPGIQLSSVGVPPAPTADAFFGVPLPGESNVQGGIVTVVNRADISTSRTGGALTTGAHGIVAVSNTSGYPQAMVDALKNYDAASLGIGLTLESLTNPKDGTALALDTTVQGVVAVTRVDDSGRTVIDSYGASAGTFTVSANGTVLFDKGSDFDALTEGSVVTVMLQVVANGTRGTLTRSDPGRIFARVEKKGGVMEVATWVDFDTWGEKQLSATGGNGLPDLNSYVRAFGALAESAGGTGGSVHVDHLAGTVLTQGAASHGILAESQGVNGVVGSEGGGFWSFGSRRPGAGTTGKDGGLVSVAVDGTITTTHAAPTDTPEDASVGVIAHSVGGAGGAGGVGGTWYFGAVGGNGGKGGDVKVTGSGSGVITTSGRSAIGLYAISEGGDGGDGGSYGAFVGGGPGGVGGGGGSVEVTGAWTITTQGADAHGIWAKSVGGNAGGGGGNGWLAGAGGAGGTASDGGSVTIDSGGRIETQGSDAFALFGQSVGGFGGTGGGGFSLFYSVGGGGGSAGSGGAVSVRNAAGGELVTSGDGSHALIAQSVGGGGGAGGSTSGLVSRGSSGAYGGDGGQVDAFNDGKITTSGDDARGIFAQSVGGGGGDGGRSGGLSAKGGSGSATSVGRDVTVTNTGTIVTGGERANAIYAQSVGGGGGNGGSSGGWFSVGGAGGAGGDAGAVTVKQEGALLRTVQADSSAVFAQSVGGGGGNGGNSASVGVFASLTIGGQGGAAGVGKDVTVDDSAAAEPGEIFTGGERSHGIFAQSIGGGGGSGGFAVGAAVGLGAGLTVAIGGDGGGGGNAGVVTVKNASAITTAKQDAVGLFAESVGGGGGSGGFSIAASASDSFALAFSFGGKGAKGGDGNAVDVTNAGGITTGGARSVGLQAQSVGGGGGSGGFAVSASAGGLGAFDLSIGGAADVGGIGQLVTVRNDGAIETQGPEAAALLAQSIGGGGGNGGFSIAGAAGGVGGGTVNLGGSGAGGGAGGAVDVTNNGTLSTAEQHSIGLFAQSVGGGGGNGGYSIAGAGGGIGAGTFNLGGMGDGGGHGNTVAVTNHGDVSTGGRASHGVLVQSVGGGGGNGGFALSGSGSGVGAGTISIGGFGGGGGNGQLVDVKEQTGTIKTAGEGAVGLFAQSLGGGGGNGGFSIAVSGAGTGAGTLNLGGSGDGGGIGGEVRVDNGGAIETAGREAHALLAQSIGGGGGNGGFSISGSAGGVGAGTVSIGGSGAGGGNGGVVGVTNRGKLSTTNDNAVGLFAQSVGGGGGNGGMSLALTAGGVGAGTLNLGGAGDGGGNGNTVTVSSFGDLSTEGRDAHGLFAQSLGGGGGNGGYALTGTAAGTGAGSVAIGGFGAGGGDAVRVDVTQTGKVKTIGEGAVGLFAQSVGGGGGNGGFSIAFSAAGTGAGTLNLGGYGAGGGVGGEVELDSNGTVETSGARAHGVFAQSVGGGGGNGGFSIAASGSGEGAGTLGIGGFAGKGGAGEAVTLRSQGSVDTDGEGATGLFAQSIGGGGGNGGFAFSGSASTNVTLSVSVGGSGGDGGRGGIVRLDSGSNITTKGNTAPAIVAQSIGGGGGSGGMALSGTVGLFTKSGVSATVVVGGRGGEGGVGGDVFVGDQASLSGKLTTAGNSAHGIHAQSVGGGGGSGGASLATGFVNDVQLGEGQKTLSATLMFGGEGGQGNIGGKVTVKSASEVETGGDDAHGIFAQSVGGGGGSGGSAEGILLSSSGLLPLKESKAKNLGLELTAGGDGGAGNKGGIVSVTNDGGITTHGVASRGIFAQSVGGGGGSLSEGVLGKVGDWVDDVTGVLDAVGVAKTIGDAFKDRSAAGLVPSTLKVTLGASEGSGADAKAVTVVNRADIATDGLAAHGIYAQSVGAGGGDANAYAKGEGGSESVSTGVGLFGEFALGGAGAAAGSGDAVSVDHTGRIQTRGEQAHGIYAQSVGGGGGQAGAAAGGFSGLDSFGFGVAFARSSGNGGNGAKVTVTSNGAIETEQARSFGILAQSIGGGGGAAADTSGIAFFGSVGGFGRGGEVGVTHEGTLVTRGERAHGIFAQSVGGKSGQTDVSWLGLGGTVDVTIRNGGIDTHGLDADGIVAQSAGLGGAGDVTVTVENASVFGGTGSGAGVRILDGRANQLVNSGAIGSRGGSAVVATSGDDSVVNRGFMVGNVDLGAGANSFANAAGASFESGTTVRLGTDKLLTNDGLLSPGGSGKLLGTAVTGRLAQGSSGTLLVDVDAMTQTADLVSVTGNANLAGRVRLEVQRPAPVQQRVVIVSAGDGVSADQLGIDASASAVARYALVRESNAVSLDYRIDFSDVVGLRANQRRVGAYVNSIQHVGSTAGFTPIAEMLFAMPTAAPLAAAYDRLSPEPHGALVNGTLFSALQFGDAMLSCRRADAESRFVREGECGWLSAGAGVLRQRASDAAMGLHRHVQGIHGGLQREVAPNTHLGVAAGVEHGSVNVADIATTTGDQVQAGLILKTRLGDSSFSAALTGGLGRYDSQRSAVAVAGPATATASPRLDFMSAQLRAAHAFARGDAYIRPSIDLGYTRVDRKAFDETGAGVANLSVHRAVDDFTTLRGAVEWGAEWARDDGSLFRPALRLGLLGMVSGSAPRTEATLQGVPAGVGPLTVQGQIDRTIGELGAALDVLNTGGTVLRLGYTGQFSRHIESHSAMLKFSMPF
jgi:hypothetical protein